MSTPHTDLVDHLLDPLAQCFTPAVAKDVVNLRFDRTIQQRLDNLREKANEGTLTEAERAEYETLIDTADFIAVLQAKSQRMLQEKERLSGLQEAVEQSQSSRLSPRDRDLFLQLLDTPPEPNDALRNAAQRFREHCG